MMILSVVLAVVVLRTGYSCSRLYPGIPAEIIESQQGTGLVTADAMAKAFGTKVMAKVIIVGGMCGIITSWNSFLLGGSRAMYSMAESYMIPPFFAKLHPKHKTPVNSLYLIGALTMLAPFAGRTMMVWICDAGNFGCCLAYCMVSISFLILRKKEPDMARPYKVGYYKFVGLYGSSHVRADASGLLYSGFRWKSGISGMDYGRRLELTWSCILCDL